MNVTAEDLLLTSKKRFPVLDDAAGEKMQAAIEQARSELDSLGGLIECGVTGLPVGLGDPMLDGMENRMARLVFAIPAVKGVAFGAGFAVAEMRGSENNDPFYYDGDTVKTRTNHAGGILGGITNGMPLVFRAAVKPTPSIARVQDSPRAWTRNWKFTADTTPASSRGRCRAWRPLPPLRSMMRC